MLGRRGVIWRQCFVNNAKNDILFFRGQLSSHIKILFGNNFRKPWGPPNAKMEGKDLDTGGGSWRRKIQKFLKSSKHFFPCFGPPRPLIWIFKVAVWIVVWNFARACCGLGWPKKMQKMIWTFFCGGGGGGVVVDVDKGNINACIRGVY